MEEKRQFPLFNGHLDLAHSHWEKHLSKTCWAIDATCGNGHDTLFLAERCAGVIAIDIQETAISNTKKRLGEYPTLEKKVHLFQQSHEVFPSVASKSPISLIVYNLGYLPGGNKTFTTLENSTLTSLNAAMAMIESGGVISLTAYPGHKEGEKELGILMKFLSTLSPHSWSVCTHTWINRLKAPVLILIQKK